MNLSSILPYLPRRLARPLQFHIAGTHHWGSIGWAMLRAQQRSRYARWILGNRLWPKGSKFPLVHRPGGSDFAAFCQIFFHREYGCVDHINSPKLIIDCGANVGYSSAYLLSRFPTAKLIAVEPDPQNYQILRRNLARFGARARTIRAGIWSHPCGLKVEAGQYRDCLEWSTQVREARSGEVADVSAVDIGSLLDGSGFHRISILKIDIERSEAQLFSRDFQKWLGLCDNIVIELHDEECRRLFDLAIDGQGFHILSSGELTACLREPLPSLAS